MGSSNQISGRTRRGSKSFVGAAICGAILFACGLLPPQTGRAAQLGDPQLPISLDAASSDFDYRNNVLVFRKVRISQGELSVQADQATATGLDFKDSQWTFVGEVRIRVPNGLLDSDSATVSFVNDQITAAKITGAPARFEQRRKDSAKLARGHAGLIEYNVEGNTIKLSNDAWLSDGASEITGQTLVYNILEERVIANPGETDRQGVSITIRPDARPAPKKEPKTDPTAGSVESPNSGGSGSAP